MISCDQRCVDLAHHFLAGDDWTEDDRVSLAGEIQQCIEDWMEAADGRPLLVDPQSGGQS